MSDWRPEGWRNLFSPAAIEVRDKNWKPVSHHEAYEAGASAMLEGLKGGGQWIDVMPPTQRGSIMLGFEIKYTKRELVKGHLVFIPEETYSYYGGNNATK